MDASSLLAAERVTSIFMDCLFREGENTKERIAAKGIARTAGFHPARIERHRHSSSFVGAGRACA